MCVLVSTQVLMCVVCFHVWCVHVCGVCGHVGSLCVCVCMCVLI